MAKQPAKKERPGRYDVPADPHYKDHQRPSAQPQTPGDYAPAGVKATRNFDFDENLKAVNAAAGAASDNDFSRLARTMQLPGKIARDILSRVQPKKKATKE